MLQRVLDLLGDCELSLRARGVTVGKIESGLDWAQFRIEDPSGLVLHVCENDDEVDVVVIAEKGAKRAQKRSMWPEATVCDIFDIFELFDS